MALKEEQHSRQKVKVLVAVVSHSCDPMTAASQAALVHKGFSKEEYTGVGSHALLLTGASLPTRD